MIARLDHVQVATPAGGEDGGERAGLATYARGGRDRANCMG
jgi:hypothetical protein